MSSSDFDIRLIDEYAALLDRKENLAELTKENNANIDQCRQKLADMMALTETVKVSRNGFSYSLSEKIRYSKKGGKDDELFELLEQFGLGSIIKQTVNAQTLQGAMANLAAENCDDDGEPQLPEEFDEVISVFEFFDVTRRRATTKIKNKGE